MIKDQTKLYLSCQMGDLKGISEAFSKNPHLINQRDKRVIFKKQGWSPLYRIVSSGNTDAAKYLLAQGAQVNLTTRTGETALHQSIDLCQYKMARVLLDFQADPNIQQNDGETALHIASFKGYSRLVVLLLEYNANPNIQSFKSKRTPLHYAVDCNYLDCALALVSQGADIHLEDTDGLSPLTLSKSQEMENILKSGVKRHSSAESFVNPFEEPLGTGEGTTYLISDLGDDKCSLGETHPQARLSYKSSGLDLKEIFSWLENIKLEGYYEILVDAGYDNSLAMMQQMRGPMPIREEDLEIIGILKPGHRKRILWKLEEDFSEKHKRKKSFSFFKCCGQIRDGTGAVISVPSLQQVLQDLSLESYLNNFTSSGYDHYEVLIAQFSSRFGLNKEIFLKEIGIKDQKCIRKFLSRLGSDVITYRPPEIICEEGKTGACEFCSIL